MEEKNPAKEFLSQVKCIDAVISSKQNQIEWLNCIATKVTPSYGNEVVSGTRSQDKIGYVSSKIADIKAEINNYIDLLIDKRKEVTEVIEQLKNSDQIKVLTYYYVGIKDNESDEWRYLKWKEISEKIHVSERHAKRIHGYALEEVGKIIKSESCH